MPSNLHPYRRKKATNTYVVTVFKFEPFEMGRVEGHQAIIPSDDLNTRHSQITAESVCP